MAERRSNKDGTKAALKETDIEKSLYLRSSIVHRVTMESYEHEAGFECSQLVIDVHYKTWRVTVKVCR